MANRPRASTDLSKRQIYTVTQINHAVHTLLEDTFAAIWVEGEVSNLSRPSSGHCYFSLKDAQAQIRCALFQNRAFLFRNIPHNGQQVLVRGRVSLYQPRGDYQIIVEYVEAAGDGALRQAYDALRRRLEQEGCFATERKQPIPRFPRQIGIISSATGAAIRDAIITLRRRCPSLPILLYPTPVQGEGAAEHIAHTIRLASVRRDCDVLLLVRGGGSLEDLWAFNEEIVARAIFDCAIPLVSGIGHETDVTIADFAADRRAATPTAAAELVSPDCTEWLHQIRLLEQRLQRAIDYGLQYRRQSLTNIQQRLSQQSPQRRLPLHNQRLDELEQRLQQALRRHIHTKSLRLQALTGRLRTPMVIAHLSAQRQQMQTVVWRLLSSIQHCLHTASQRTQHLSARLQTLSPLATLTRGYCILRRPDTGQILHRASDGIVGEVVEALLSEGRLQCEIKARSITD